MNRLVAVLLFSTAFVILAMIASDAQEPAEQQPEPEPFAADGIPPVPLPEEPVVYDTAQRQRIRVSIVAAGLTYPWGFAFLPTAASSSPSAWARCGGFATACSTRPRSRASPRSRSKGSSKA